MSIDKIDHPWAESGSLDTTLTDDKRDVGWVSGDSPDRPTVERFNLLQNTTDNKINHNLLRSPRTYIDNDANSTTVAKAFFPTSKSAGKITDSQNFFENIHGSTNLYAHCYIENETGRGIISSTAGTRSLDLYDFDTGTSTTIVTSAQIKAGLPGTWTSPDVYALCTDNTYVYAVCKYSTERPRIQAYRISDSNVKLGWPSTGTELSAGSVSYDFWELVAVWGDDSKILITQPWVDVTSGTAGAVSVIDESDGSILGTGAGDFSGSTGKCVGVCGNGTDCFFVVQGATSAEICSMDLTSYGSTGSGGTGFPFSDTHNDGEFSDIKCAGETVVSSWIAGDIIRIIHAADGEILSAATGDATKINRLMNIVFTGMSWWGLATSTDQLELIVRLDIVDRYARTTGLTGVTIDEAVKYFAGAGGLSFNSYAPAGALIYDDRDLWVVEKNSVACADHLYRFPKANARH